MNNFFSVSHFLERGNIEELKKAQNRKKLDAIASSICANIPIKNFSSIEVYKEKINSLTIKDAISVTKIYKNAEIEKVGELPYLFFTDLPNRSDQIIYEIVNRALGAR